MIKGVIQGFPFSSGEFMRTFRRIVKDGQELILLFDTGRRSDYKRSSF